MIAIPRPRIKRRWFVLALFTGAAAALAAGVWADRPSWSNASLGTGVVLDFSRDGTMLYTAHGLGAAARPVRIARWDAATGRVLEVVAPDWSEPPGSGWSHFIRLVWDGNVALVGAIQPEACDPPVLVYHLFDADSGRRLAGPMTVIGDPYQFSTDGRWFCSARRDGIDVIAVATGQPVVRISARPDAQPTGVCFSPESDRLAVLWQPRRHRDWADSVFVQIIDLPAGRELLWTKLPPRQWTAVRAWREGRLFIEVGEAAPAELCRRSYSFGLSDGGLGEEREEPLLAGFMAIRSGDASGWDSGPGWVAHVDVANEQVVPAWRQWLEAAGRKLGLKLDRPRFITAGVHFLDPAAGKMRAEIPPVPYPYAISTGGRRVAAVGPMRGVEVWDVDRLPPWLWSLPAGVLGGGLVLVLPYGLRRMNQAKALAPVG